MSEGSPQVSLSEKFTKLASNTKSRLFGVHRYSWISTPHLGGFSGYCHSEVTFLFAQIICREHRSHFLPSLKKIWAPHMLGHKKGIIHPTFTIIYLGKLQYFTNLNSSAILGYLESSPCIQHHLCMGFGRSEVLMKFTQIYGFRLLVEVVQVARCSHPSHGSGPWHSIIPTAWISLIPMRINNNQ